jgi:uncharacterized protein (UPF0212 family)
MVVSNTGVCILIFSFDARLKLWADRVGKLEINKQMKNCHTGLVSVNF